MIDKRTLQIMNGVMMALHEMERTNEQVTPSIVNRLACQNLGTLIRNDPDARTDIIGIAQVMLSMAIYHPIERES